LGEVQLGAILEQILTPEQYSTKVATKARSRENVEFAIKFPGQNDNIVWLPIDAKFPTEDYQRLIEAQEKCDLESIKVCGDALEARIKQQAKDIRDKYINPPDTTDFGILFLPFEGLYAEVLRRPGLYEYISRQYKITIAGPTTIAALLNSLQMGFRTLAIQKRAGEVWQLLGAVKTEFGKFAEIFEKAHNQILSAGETLEVAASKSRNIERKLKKVQILPAQVASILLEAAEESADETSQEANS
jgi:DNA recombination protein RmuC